MKKPSNSSDWKDVVATYFDKCLAITLLFTIFAFIVFPDVEISAITSAEKVQETIEILEEIQEMIKPPEEEVREIVSFEIVDPDDDDASEVEYATAEELEQILEEYEREPEIPVIQDVIGETPRFVIYEDAPQIRVGATPEYPEWARRQGIQGTVILDIEVLASGNIGAIEVFRSLIPDLDKAAVDAVRKWQMQPAMSGGQPVSVWLRQPITFTIN
jgi:TonB family protein